MSIIINGTTLGSDASIDSTKLNKIIFNNTTVWESIAPPIEISLSPIIYVISNAPYGVSSVNYVTFTLKNNISNIPDLSKYKYLSFYIETYDTNFAASLKPFISRNGTTIADSGFYSRNHYEYIGKTSPSYINDSLRLYPRLTSNVQQTEARATVHIKKIRLFN